FVRVHARHASAWLFIAGEGDVRDALEELIARAGVADVVRLAGQRDDMPRVLAGCDVFVLPSVYEGFSNAILEALASGLPVIATDVGGAREQLRDGETGFVVPRGDEDALVKAMEALAADDAMRARM